jgi:hypothetical protein
MGVDGCQNIGLLFALSTSPVAGGDDQVSDGILIPALVSLVVSTIEGGQMSAALRLGAGPPPVEGRGVGRRRGLARKACDDRNDALCRKSRRASSYTDMRAATNPSAGLGRGPQPWEKLVECRCVRSATKNRHSTSSSGGANIATPRRLGNLSHDSPFPGCRRQSLPCTAGSPLSSSTA